MANELEAEFIKTISQVTKEVTDDVVRHSALVSVNELNGTLKSLKAESGQLVTDIQKAKSMYESVSNHSQQSCKTSINTSTLGSMPVRETKSAIKIKLTTATERCWDKLNSWTNAKSVQYGVETAIRRCRTDADRSKEHRKQTGPFEPEFQDMQKQMKETKRPCSRINQPDWIQRIFRRGILYDVLHAVDQIGILLYMVQGLFIGEP